MFIELVKKAASLHFSSQGYKKIQLKKAKKEGTKNIELEAIFVLALLLYRNFFGWGQE